MQKKTVQTLIRLLLHEQSDQGLHYLSVNQRFNIISLKRTSGQVQIQTGTSPDKNLSDCVPIHSFELIW